MRTLLILLLIPCLNFLSAIDTEAQERWTVEFLGGGAYCLKTPLTLRQTGYEDIHVTANYATHSLTPPIYYSMRFAAWKETRAWELELIHLKLKLRNLPDDVQRFEISHGYNFFMLNRVWSRSEYLLRLGAGIIITHPENTVRDQSLNEHRGMMGAGYYISGPAIQAAIGKKFHITQHLFGAIEGKFTGSYASVPLRHGDADVLNGAFHAVLGFGYGF